MKNIIINGDKDQSLTSENRDRNIFCQGKKDLKEAFKVEESVLHNCYTLGL